MEGLEVLAQRLRRFLHNVCGHTYAYLQIFVFMVNMITVNKFPLLTRVCFSKRTLARACMQTHLQLFLPVFFPFLLSDVVYLHNLLPIYSLSQSLHSYSCGNNQRCVHP